MASKIYKHTFKCIVVGASQSGKTSIIQRLCENSFGQTTATNANSYFGHHSFFSHPHKIKLDIWDTPGMDGTHCLDAAECKGANIGIIVFDMLRRESLEEVSDWKRKLMEVGAQNIVIGIAANKCENYDAGMIEMNQIQNEFNIADEILFGTSARANVNVVKLFFETALKAAKQKKI